MKKSNNKLKLSAFTIVELLTVMMISILVISAMYSVWRIIDRTVFKFNETSEIVSEQTDCLAWLKQDFQNARNIEREGDNIVFHFNDYQIVYDFNINKNNIDVNSNALSKKQVKIKRILYKNEEIQDSNFNIFILKMNTFYRNKLVNQGKIDYLELTFLGENKALNQIVLTKEYASADLIKIE